MGSKPGERRGGRQKGTPNKRTLIKIQQAQHQFAEAKASGRRLAIDEMEWLVEVFKIGVEFYRPKDFANIDPDKEQRFFKYASSMRQVLGMLAPYQSATFRSILLGQPVAETQQDESAAERLIKFFDGLAESTAFEQQQRKVEKVPAEPREDETMMACGDLLFICAIYGD